MALNQAQQAHVNGAFPECRSKIAKYLEENAEVVVYRQNECGSDVEPYAVAPKVEHDFWLGCWDTPELAAAQACVLGLRVVEVTP
ncbi:hypothetical protein [Pseudomonas sp. GOM6]|uniref:hypothetical protein n=1 Tax=Pseudomonas sp. GOM6 TaxID=3036944 RepID=UPI002409F455|nr:hypothetical protein [Pseudomonas sp. GOM6]MDG1581012.1 hypothetical protein [Pseudomonas sp. GOM6]